MGLLWLFLLPGVLMTLYLGMMTVCSLAAQRSIRRRLRDIEITLAEAKTELAALKCLTKEDAEWLARYDTMTEQPQPTWPLPPIGSFWEWNLGMPMGREIIEVLNVQFSPLTVRIKGSSGEREVSLDEFSHNAVPAPLRGHKG